MPRRERVHHQQRRLRGRRWRLHQHSGQSHLRLRGRLHAADGLTCTDINECTTNNGGCAVVGGVCTNTPGSRTCACAAGFSGNGLTCTDVNECTTNNGGCAAVGGVCTNTPGSRTCACAAGFSGNGLTCTDVNECSTNNGGCAAVGGVCTNTPGSRTCACASGFSGNGLTCTDVNECTTNNGGCAAVGGVCTNTPGSRTCACASGYSGNGLTCASTNICSPACNTPPATACVGTAVRTFATSGNCAASTCTYSYTDTPCSTGCTNGVCNAVTCGATTCNTPPVGACTSPDTLSTSYPQGRCTGATCSYTAREIFCSQGCLNGACLPGSWTFENSPFTMWLSADKYRLAFDALNRPMIAGCTLAGDVVLRRLLETGWEEETIDLGLANPCFVALAVTATNEPMVAWYDALSGDLRFALRNGGTWSPRELIATQDDSGAGVSMVSVGGVPSVAFTYTDALGNSTVKYATRTAPNAWTTETVIAGAGGATQLARFNNTTWLAIDGVPSLVAARGAAGGWTFSPPVDLSAGPSTLLEGSLLVNGTVPSLMLNTGTQSYWRTQAADWTQEVVDQPVEAVRTTLPLAALVRTTSTSNVHALRVKRGDAWVPQETSLPYDYLLGPVLSYAGAGGRHVLIDVAGHRLSSPPPCVPLCTGRTCGEDGCGGSCGACGSGSCSPAGTCSAFTQQTTPGWSGLAALGANATTVSLAQGLTVRSKTGASWSTGVPFAASGKVKQNQVFIESSGAPLICAEPAAPTAAANLVVHKLVGSAWTPSALSAGTLGIDADDVWYAVRNTTTKVFLRTAINGVWGAEATVYTLPFSWGAVWVRASAVSGTGAVTMVLERSYWVSGTNPGYQFAYDLYSNETGAWVLTSLGWPPTSGGEAAQLVFDPQGVTHLLSTRGYFTRQGGGALVPQTLPAGLPANWGVPRLLLADRTGVMHLVYYDNAGGLTVARHAPTGQWTLESMPLINNVTPSTSAVPRLAATFDANNVLFVALDDAQNNRLISK